MKPKFVLLVLLCIILFFSACTSKQSDVPINNRDIVTSANMSMIIDYHNSAKSASFMALVGKFISFTENDVVSVCAGDECAGVEEDLVCTQTADVIFICKSFLKLKLTEEAATRMAMATLLIEEEPNSPYLSENIILYHDSAPVNEMKIDRRLRGRIVKDMMIPVIDSGSTQEEAEIKTRQSIERLKVLFLGGI